MDCVLCVVEIVVEVEVEIENLWCGVVEKGRRDGD